MPVYVCRTGYIVDGHESVADLVDRMVQFHHKPETELKKTDNFIGELYVVKANIDMSNNEIHYLIHCSQCAGSYCAQCGSSMVGSYCAPLKYKALFQYPDTPYPGS